MYTTLRPTLLSMHVHFANLCTEMIGAIMTALYVQRVDIPSHVGLILSGSLLSTGGAAPGGNGVLIRPSSFAPPDPVGSVGEPSVDGGSLAPSPSPAQAGTAIPSAATGSAAAEGPVEDFAIEGGGTVAPEIEGPPTGETPRLTTGYEYVPPLELEVVGEI